MRALEKKLIDWISNYFDRAAPPAAKAVIGLTDTAGGRVCLSLCTRALGASRVKAIIFSDYDTNENVCEKLGITDYVIVNYDELNFYLKNLRLNDNSLNRLQMLILYSYAESLAEGGKVCNTTNYSEKFIGLNVRLGDAEGDFNPLGGLLDKSVQDLNRSLQLPEYAPKELPYQFTWADLDEYLIGRDSFSNLPEKTKQEIETIHLLNYKKYNPPCKCF